MMHVGRRLASRWLVAALLLVFGLQTARASCGHYAKPMADAGHAGVAGLDGLGLAGALATASSPGTRLPSPGFPASPCRGLRCSRDVPPPTVLSRLAWHADPWGGAEPRRLADPYPSAPFAFEDDDSRPSDRADRLDRPPR